MFKILSINKIILIKNFKKGYKNKASLIRENNMGDIVIRQSKSVITVLEEILEKKNLLWILCHPFILNVARKANVKTQGYQRKANSNVINVAILYAVVCYIWKLKVYHFATTRRISINAYHVEISNSEYFFVLSQEACIIYGCA